MSFYYEKYRSHHGDIKFSERRLFVKINQEYFPIVGMNTFETVWYEDKNGKEQVILPQRSRTNGDGHDGVYISKMNNAPSLWWDKPRMVTKEEADERFRREAFESVNRERDVRDAIFFGTPSWKLR